MATDNFSKIFLRWVILPIKKVKKESRKDRLIFLCGTSLIGAILSILLLFFYKDFSRSLILESCIIFSLSYFFCRLGLLYLSTLLLVLLGALYCYESLSSIEATNYQALLSELNLIFFPVLVVAISFSWRVSVVTLVLFLIASYSFLFIRFEQDLGPVFSSMPRVILFSFLVALFVYMRDRDRKGIKRQARELEQQGKLKVEYQNRILEGKKLALLQQEQLTAAYKRFVPNQFIEMLGKKSIMDVKKGDRILKTMTILVSDISSFTSVSEDMTPDASFQFVNRYLERMEPIIAKHGGFIDKYIGDAILGLFGENSENALNAAIEMFVFLREYDKELEEKRKIPIKMGIGIHTGPLVLGTVGSETRIDYTVISDAVNLAFRIEAYTRVLKTGLLVTQHVVNSLENPQAFHFRLVDTTFVKGRQSPIKIYEVFDIDPEEIIKKKEESYPFFDQAHLYLQEKKLNDAKILFEKCIEICPEDEVAKYFIEHLKVL